jgi:hypothetical protein
MGNVLPGPMVPERPLSRSLGRYGLLPATMKRPARTRRDVPGAPSPPALPLACPGSAGRARFGTDRKCCPGSRHGMRPPQLLAKPMHLMSGPCLTAACGCSATPTPPRPLGPLADRQERDRATADSRHLAIAADAELRRRHPDQQIEPLHPAEPTVSDAERQHPDPIPHQRSGETARIHGLEIQRQAFRTGEASAVLSAMRRGSAARWSECAVKRLRIAAGANSVADRRLLHDSAQLH